MLDENCLRVSHGGWANGHISSLPIAECWGGVLLPDAFYQQSIPSSSYAVSLRVTTSAKAKNKREAAM